MQYEKQMIITAFKIRPGEELVTGLLLLHSFFVGIALIFFETAAYALFLKAFPATTLPTVYIGAAFAVTAAGFVYDQLESRVAFKDLLNGTLVFFAVSVILFYLATQWLTSNWVFMGLLIWQQVLAALLGIELWGLAGHLLNVRQGKRLFGLIGTGEIVAGALGGFSIPLLIRGALTTPQMLLVSAIGILGCILVLRHITRSFHHEFAFQAQEERLAPQKPSRDRLNPFKDRYLLLVFGFAVFSVFGYYLIDYVFYGKVESAFASDEARIASFLGVFFAVLSILSLIGNAFVPSRFMARYGLRFGVLAVPVLVAVLAGVSVFAETVWGGEARIWLFFPLIAATKLFDEVARNAIGEPSLRILYQPFPAGQRLRVQTVLESMVEPLAGAAVGGAILLIIAFAGPSSTTILIAALIILAGWIVLSTFLFREYTAVLNKALSRRTSIDLSNFLQDAKSQELLKQRLTASSVPGEVIYCLNLLEELEHEDLDHYLIQLLSHPAPAVRIHVLSRIEILGVSPASEGLAAIHRLLVQESDPKARGNALIALSAVAGADAFEEVAPLLDETDPDIRKGAIIGLIRYAGIEGLLSAGRSLNTLMDSSSPRDRRLGAEILGEMGTSSFYRPLLKLLDDDSPEVQRAAVVASGRLRNPKLLPPLMEKLTDPVVRSAASSAIIALGEPILPELAAAFDRESVSMDVKIRIMRILGRIGGEEAIGILRSKIDAEEDIRNHILGALVSSGYQASGREIPRMYERIRREVEDATWALATLVDVGEYGEVGELREALHREIDKNRKRIFQLLAIIYPRETILNAQANLQGRSSDKAAYSLEILDNTVSPDIKALIFPLLEAMDPGMRLSRLREHFPQERVSQHERIKEILGRSGQSTSSWTKAMALFTVGRIATMEFYDVVISSLSDPDAIVRETAVWTLGCLNPNDLPDRLRRLTRDRSPRVARFARFVINTAGFASIPMSHGYLTRSGRYTVDLFKNILDDEGERRVRRCRAANILARFTGAAARRALMSGLTISDKIVRTAVLDALIKGKFEISHRSRGELLTLLRIEIHDARRVVRSIATLMAGPHAERLIQSLNSEIHRTRSRILSILSLLTDSGGELESVFYWYIHQGAQTVPEPVHKALMGLIQEIPDEEGMRTHIRALFQYRHFDGLRKLTAVRKALHTPDRVRQELSDIAFGSSVFTLSWSRICALEMIVRLGLDDLVSRVVANLEDPDDIVRATSTWALWKLNPDVYARHARRLRGDPSPIVSRTARQLDEGAPGEVVSEAFSQAGGL